MLQKNWENIGLLLRKNVFNWGISLLKVPGIINRLFFYTLFTKLCILIKTGVDTFVKWKFDNICISFFLIIKQKCFWKNKNSGDMVNQKNVDGWMDEMGLTSDELRSGLLPTDWNSTQSLISRQLISQFWSLDKVAYWDIDGYRNLF